MTTASDYIIGMCETTGSPISGIDHVRQCLSRIILTRIGTRVQRRDFGSNLMSLVSAPGNEAMRLKLIGVIAQAILKWEPRVKLSHIGLDIGFDGKADITVHGSYDGQSLNHQVQMFGGAS